METLARCRSPRPTGELQITLEHLWDAVHAPVPEGSSAAEHRQRPLAIAVDAAFEHHPVRLADRAQRQRLHPEVHERREPVVDLREVDLRRPEPGPLPQAPRRLLPDLHDVVQGPVQREAVAHRGPRGVPGHVHRTVGKVPGALSRREHERSHAVDGNVAVEPADGVVDHRFRQVLLGRERLVVPVRPRDSGPVLAGLGHHRGHGLTGRAVALEVLGVGQRDHGQRAEVALGDRPLLVAAGLRHRVGVVRAARVVQGTVHEHVVGRPAHDGVDRQRDRPRQLAEALEAGGVAGVHAEAFGQPVGRHQADAVHGSMGTGRREEAGRHEPVDLSDRSSPASSDRPPCRLDGQGAERRLGVPFHIGSGRSRRWRPGCWTPSARS